MKKSLIIIVYLLAFIYPTHAQSFSFPFEVSHTDYKFTSFDYKNVRLIREEYYTYDKLDRVGGPAVIYSSVRHTFNNKSLPIFWREAKVYYQEWWLDGVKYSKINYNKQLRDKYGN